MESGSERPAQRQRPLPRLYQYENAKTDKGRARALYNRIEFFIETDGSDLTAKELKAIEAERARAVNALQKVVHAAAILSDDEE